VFTAEVSDCKFYYFSGNKEYEVNAVLPFDDTESMNDIRTVTAFHAADAASLTNGMPNACGSMEQLKPRQENANLLFGLHSSQLSEQIEREVEGRENQLKAKLDQNERCTCSASFEPKEDDYNADKCYCTIICMNVRNKKSTVLQAYESKIASLFTKPVPLSNSLIPYEVNVGEVNSVHQTLEEQLDIAMEAGDFNFSKISRSFLHQDYSSETLSQNFEDRRWVKRADVGKFWETAGPRKNLNFNPRSLDPEYHEFDSSDKAFMPDFSYLNANPYAVTVAHIHGPSGTDDALTRVCLESEASGSNVVVSRSMGGATGDLLSFNFKLDVGTQRCFSIEHETGNYRRVSGNVGLYATTGKASISLINSAVAHCMKDEEHNGLGRSAVQCCPNGPCCQDSDSACDTSKCEIDDEGTPVCAEWKSMVDSSSMEQNKIHLEFESRIKVDTDRGDAHPVVSLSSKRQKNSYER
jgi:hypothetical protein